MLSDNISVNILDILVFRQKKAKYYTNKRPFYALSFRLISNSSYLYKNKKIRSDTNSISFVPANIGYDRVTDDEELIVFHFDMYNFVTDEIQVFTPNDYSAYRSLFKQALDIWQKKEPGYKYAATAVFYNILSQMQIDGSIAAKTKSEFIYDSAEYMKAHFGDADLSVSKLAERACVSESFFRRKFRQYYGMSPKKYLDSLRIQYAVSLLRSDYYSQKEIALMCGFQDVKYFRTAFKAKTGKCISKYIN